MALESRAYTAPGPKTSLRELVDTIGQRITRWLLLLGIVALGFIALGLHSFACARWVRLLGSTG